MLSLTANDPGITEEARRRNRERRSAWLRLVALLILVANLAIPNHEDRLFVHANIVAGYAVATAIALVLALRQRGPVWSDALFVIVDAALIIALFHEHLFAPGRSVDHSLTAPSLAVGFLLLAHVALRLQTALVLLFGGLVLTGWLSLLIGLAVSQTMDGSGDDFGALWADGALATAFGFAVFVCWLLLRDHDVLLKRAVSIERRRRNLARFFSPNVLSELQASNLSLTLGRRDVAVMFVDLRAFTRFSEGAPAEEVASLLAAYRELVTQVVFAHGGMIDKFIGDGVMAVFGQPRATSDDATNALRCAVELRLTLRKWAETRRKKELASLEAGIGLHMGLVMAGILQSSSHDEFTLFGDAVNVAERLERLCKRLDASLVASEAVVAKAGVGDLDADWVWLDSVELEGRLGRLAIVYLPRDRIHS